MKFLKQVGREIIATVKPTLVLLILLVARFKIVYIPALFLLSSGLCIYLNFFAVAVINGQKPWRSLGSPPEKPNEIVMTNHTDILVKTSTGKYFQCTFREEGQFDYSDNISTCWQETEDQSLNNFGNYILQLRGGGNLSWWVGRPGKVIHSMSIATTFEDAGYSRTDIILENGEVFLGDEIGWSALDPWVMLLFLSGIIGGIVLSSVVLLIKRQFRK